MDTFGPTVPQLLLHGTPSELEPGLVEEVARLVNARPPDHHGRRIRHQAEPFFTLTQSVLDPSASDALNKQTGNQGRLQHNDARRPDDVELVPDPTETAVET